MTPVSLSMPESSCRWLCLRCSLQSRHEGLFSNPLKQSARGASSRKQRYSLAVHVLPAARNRLQDLAARAPLHRHICQGRRAVGRPVESTFPSQSCSRSLRLKGLAACWASPEARQLRQQHWAAHRHLMDHPKANLRGSQREHRGYA